jgi:hypothetical protein
MKKASKIIQWVFAGIIATLQYVLFVFMLPSDRIIPFIQYIFVEKNMIPYM